jgi:hypothetical protein
VFSLWKSDIRRKVRWQEALNQRASAIAGSKERRECQIGGMRNAKATKFNGKGRLGPV